MELPPQETWNWVQGVLPEGRVVSQTGHDHGYSNLWRLLGADGEHYWLKMHRFPGKWAGEVHALTRWAPSLGRTPTLVAFREDPCAVILTECPGTDAESADLSPAQEERMWSEAGAWLRRLHANTNDWLGAINVDGSAQGEHVTDPERYVGDAFERWLREGAEQQLLGDDEVRFVRERTAEWLPALRGASIHAVHRDFTPRNWLCGTDGELTAVIDFEHGRWDVQAADLNRWWDHEFLRNPRLRDAFFDAYGQPDERLQAQIAVTRLLNATSGIVWAIRVNDQPFAERNRRALRRIMDEN